MGTPRARVALALLLTLTALHIVHDRRLVVLLLVLIWFALYRPFRTPEPVAFAIAAGFFLFQNHVSLKAGLFEFRFKDILLMPYYEPFLWGFYFLSMKRFVSGYDAEPLGIDPRAIAAVVVTSIAFSGFATNSRALFFATACSTAFLFVLFHSRRDVSWALCALALGFVVEFFGVSTGLWWYPAPDVFGIPFWFATMWISVGLLGRRFLFPLAEWLTGKVRP